MFLFIIVMFRFDKLIELYQSILILVKIYIFSLNGWWILILVIYIFFQSGGDDGLLGTIYFYFILKIENDSYCPLFESILLWCPEDL